MPRSVLDADGLCEVAGRPLAGPALDDLLFGSKAEVESHEGSALSVSVTPDRLDLLSEGGLGLYVQGVLGTAHGIPSYRAHVPPEASARFEVEVSVGSIRPSIAGVLLRAPDGRSLDDFYLARRNADEVQLDLFKDYASNVALYPKFQEYFREYQPPLLATWGKNDPFFLPAGAEAFKRDIPTAEVHFYDTGHFALETHCREIADAIARFLDDVTR